MKIKRVVIKHIFFVSFFLFAGRVFPQFSDIAYYNRIDKKISAFSEKEGNNFDSLVRFVNQTFISDREKIRAFYTWIALNISYDKELLTRYKENSSLGLRRLSSSGTQHADTVLKYRKAVCEGFSLLMNKCCEHASIISKMVIGVTKHDDEVADDIMHTWNAVKLDTAWYLLDVTWSNGYVNQMNQYKKQFSDRYFFTNPAQFVKDHWPLDPMWQLSAYPLPKESFYRGAANEHPVFFNYQDSITAFLKLRSDTAEYVSFMHYHWNDPANELYTRACDNIIHDRLVNYLNLAAVYFDDYQRYAKKYDGKPVTEKVLKECVRLLQEPRKYLVIGLNYAKNKQFFHDEVRLSFEKMAAISANNLRDMENSLESYKKLAKTIRSNKK